MNSNTLKQEIIFHERPISEVKFNSDGDYLIAASREGSISMIKKTAEILGSFEKERIAVNAICTSKDKIFGAYSDASITTWDIFTGKQIANVETESLVGSLFEDNNILYILSGNAMNKTSYFGIYDLRTNKIQRVYEPSRTGTKGFFYNDLYVFGDNDGFINQFDVRNNTLINEIKAHYSEVTSVTPSACRTFFSSSSSDATVKIVDTVDFQTKKSFDCEDPVKSSAIFPSNDKIITCGGTLAREVTKTRGKSTFDLNVFDIVTAQKIGFYSVHIGTINTVAISPNGTQSVSGSEDGHIVLLTFGEDFFSAPFTKF
ncbi:eif3i [Nucleospora cyclopteri]